MASEKNISLLSLAIPVVIVNIIEIILLLTRMKMLSNFEKMLFSLAVADLLVGFAQGIVSFLKIADVDFKGIKFNSIFLFTLAASFNHVNAITVDRFLAVCWPIKHRLWVTKKVIITCVIILWVLNGFMLIPLFVADSLDYIRRILAILSVIYAGLMTFIYSFIIYKAIICRRKSFQGQSSVNAEQAKKDFQLVIISACIVVTFMICTIPLAISAFISEELPWPVKFVLILNSFFNPFIYFFWKFSERRSRNQRSSSS